MDQSKKPDEEFHTFVKTTIYKIMQASMLSTSLSGKDVLEDTAVKLIFNFLCRVAYKICQKLHNSIPESRKVIKRDDYVSFLAEKLYFRKNIAYYTKLNRMKDIMSESACNVKESLSDYEDDENDDALLFATALDEPESHRSFVDQIEKGRILRYQRINCFSQSQTTAEYLEFSKLRQNTGFSSSPPIVKRFSFWFLSINSTLPNARSLSFASGGMSILAYLFSRLVYDLIDVCLSQRESYNIEMSTPLSKVEIKTNIKIFESMV